MKRGRARKADTPKKKTFTAPKTATPGPLWTRPEDLSVPLHPELDAALQRSGAFLSTVYIDKTKGGCFRYPVGPTYHALIGGLHKRMKKRFFRGTEVEGFSLKKAFHFNEELKVRKVCSAGGGSPMIDMHISLQLNCHKSSEAAGKKADEALALAIKTQKAPPPYRARGASPYATAVWDWCKANGYRLVLTQLPVIFIINDKASVATCGDYFAVHEETGELTLIELKCGFPVEDYKRDPSVAPMVMNPPLNTVPLTTENRWHLQVMLTHMAYERELKMRIPRVHVLNVFKAKDMNITTVYQCRLLEQPEWTRSLAQGGRLNVLYDALSEGAKKKRKNKK